MSLDTPNTSPGNNAEKGVELPKTVSLVAKYRSPVIFENVEEKCYDLSMEGMFIASDNPAPTGTLLKLKCQADGDPNIIEIVAARVVEVRERNHQGAPSGMEVKFIKIEPGGAEIIERIRSKVAGIPNIAKKSDQDKQTEPEKKELPKAFRFEIFGRDGAKIGEQTISGDVIKIGKLDLCHLRLEDDGISRLHAVIEVRKYPSDIRIIDLGSTTGTLVNGKKINASFIQNGDTLTLGGLKVKVHFEKAGSAGQSAKQEVRSLKRPEPEKRPEPVKSPEPEKKVFTISGPVTVPAGQHLRIDTLKNIPGHTVTVEDGASVTIEKAFAGATIKLLGPNAKWEIKQKIGDIKNNPIKIIHHDGTIEYITN